MKGKVLEYLISKGVKGQTMKNKRSKITYHQIEQTITKFQVHENIRRLK